MVAYFEDIKDDDGSTSLDTFLDASLGNPFIEFGLALFDDPARAEEPHDSGRGSEAAGHERHATVLIYVRDGLTT